MRKNIDEGSHENEPDHEKNNVLHVVPPFGSRADRMRDQVMEYHDEVRSRSKAEERYFESLELLKKKITAQRADEDGRGHKKVIGKCSPYGEPRLPQDEEF